LTTQASEGLCKKRGQT